ncbi:hypothetical protein ALI144C_35645 [Actinosynnema sp. ALI-1.44]|nr:hypothetical protein ALI144C_35645 [Actinosynnema sp. ALI-1.44]
MVAGTQQFAFGRLAMGKHRLDKGDDNSKWGGPDLVTELDGQQPTTHSAGDRGSGAADDQSGSTPDSPRR